MIIGLMLRQQQLPLFAGLLLCVALSAWRLVPTIIVVCVAVDRDPPVTAAAAAQSERHCVLPLCAIPERTLCDQRLSRHDRMLQHELTAAEHI